MLLLLGPFDVVLQQPVRFAFRQDFGPRFHGSDRRHAPVFVLPGQGSEALEVRAVVLLDAVELRVAKKSAGEKKVVTDNFANVLGL